MVYDGCPKSFSFGLWWDRTTFGEVATASCPVGSVGKAKRSCNGDTSGWDEPDLFNCTSDKFVSLHKVVCFSLLLLLLLFLIEQFFNK